MSDPNGDPACRTSPEIWGQRTSITATTLVNTLPQFKIPWPPRQGVVIANESTTAMIGISFDGVTVVAWLDAVGLGPNSIAKFWQQPKDRGMLDITVITLGAAATVRVTAER